MIYRPWRRWPDRTWHQGECQPLTCSHRRRSWFSCTSDPTSARYNNHTERVSSSSYLSDNPHWDVCAEIPRVECFSNPFKFTWNWPSLSQGAPQYFSLVNSGISGRCPCISKWIRPLFHATSDLYQFPRNIPRKSASSILNEQRAFVLASIFTHSCQLSQEETLSRTAWKRDRFFLSALSNIVNR